MQIQKAQILNRIKISCRNCGNEFEVPNCRKDEAKFCSRKCKSNSMKGNTPWNKNKKMNKELYPNYGMRNKNHTEETKRRIKLIKSKNQVKLICKTCNKEFKVRPSLQNKRKFCSRECYVQSEEHRLVRRNLRPHKKGEYKHSKETIEKQKITRKERYPNGIINKGCFKKGNKSYLENKTLEEVFGKKKALEIKKKMSIASINKWKDPIYREKTIKACLKGLLKRPTKYEKRIAELCIENNLPFIYTGNGTFLINFKNPDFVNFQGKIVIEVFSNYFKIRDYGSIENYKEFCRKKYEPLGWKVIFIGEEDIDEHYQKRDNWKEVCLNKIMEVK